MLTCCRSSAMMEQRGGSSIDEVGLHSRRIPRDQPNVGWVKEWAWAFQWSREKLESTPLQICTTTPKTLCGPTRGRSAIGSRLHAPPRAPRSCG